MARLGDVCTVVSGTTPKSSCPEYWDGDINWVTPAELNDESDVIYESQRKITKQAVVDSSLKSFPAGTVLLSSRAPIGKVAIAGTEMYCNQGFKNLICSDAIYNRYLYHFLKSKTGYLNSLGRGATFKEISKSIVEEIEIPLPSLEEQGRIAAWLDKVSDLIAKRQAQLDKLDLLVKARFVEMTENSETVLTRMGDVATYVNGYAFKPTNWSEKGLPIIRIQNLNNANAEYNYFDGVLPEKYLVCKGDVLVSWATHLEAYIWKGNDAWLNQHIFKVVFDKIPINDVYFVYSTEKALRQAFRNAHGFKPTMEHIKRSDFEDAVIQLPDVEVQNTFAQFAAQVDQSKLTIQRSLDKLETLKKALMQQYF